MTREKNARRSSPTIACRAMGGRGETESSARAETRCTPGRLEASHLSVVIITDLRRNAPSRQRRRDVCFFVIITFAFWPWVRSRWNRRLRIEERGFTSCRDGSVPQLAAANDVIKRTELAARRNCTTLPARLPRCFRARRPPFPLPPRGSNRTSRAFSGARDRALRFRRRRRGKDGLRKF